MSQSARKLLSIFVLAVYVANQIILAPLAEASFWDERRKTVDNSPTQVASLPSIYNQLSGLKSPLLTSPALSISQKIKNLHVPAELQGIIRSIPLSYVNIQDIYSSGHPSRPPVLLIQDVHLNAEAQTNIAATLQTLIDQNQIGTVGVEGAFTPFNFRPFRVFDIRLRRFVNDSYLNANKLAAPSYVGITSPTEPPTFIGVDDREHYDKNVAAYLSSRPMKETV